MAYTDVDNSTNYFRVKIYNGDGTDDRNITWDESSNMQPDMLWSKRRDSADNYSIYDIVRGSGLELRTNTTDADLSRTNNIQALQTNGFQVGTDGQVNASGGTYVSWGWLANNTSGSSNTNGSITSTVSANTTSGFSIVSYTGTGANATVGHGLNSPAKFIILKRRDATNDWEIGSDALGWDKHLYFTTGAANSSSDRWQNTAPTNSVFYIQTAAGNNASSSPFIAYCFAEKKGFSKFGSYTGNGNADGTFVYTGFKPAFVMIKRTDTTNNWLMYDNKRDSDNIVGNILHPNLSNAQDIQTTANVYDFTSNGFKARSTYVATNASGGSYIYMAFAESPLVGTNNIPATAR